MKIAQAIAFLAAALAWFVLSILIGIIARNFLARVIVLAILAFAVGAIAAKITDDRIAETRYGIALTLGSIAGSILSLML